MPKQSATFAVMTISPDTPSVVVGPEGGPFGPAPLLFSVFNDGTTEQLSWSVTCDVAWLDISRTSGLVGPNRSQQTYVTPNVSAQALAEGQHVATLTFHNDSASVASSGQPATVVRTVQLSVTGASLQPGAGWGGATSEPGQIGSGTAKCIARWDVVPYQYVAEADTPTFTIGVVAFHIAGIEKVSFSVEDGTWVDVTEMTLNQRTGVWEYCATLNLADFAADGLVEIRAIAYPKAAAPRAEGTGAYPGGGYPRLLESMYLYLDVDAKQTANVAYCAPWGSDSTGAGTSGNPVKTMFKAAQVCHAAGAGGADASNAIVYMMGGDYEWGLAGGGTTPLTPNGWITFTPAPGYTPDQVRVTTEAGNLGTAISKVRFKSMRLHVPVHGTPSQTDKIWLDDMGVSAIDDNDPATLVTFEGWVINFLGGTYWTDCFGGNEGSTLPAAVTLARNCHFDRCMWACNNAKLIVNCSWRNLNGWGSTVYHPDFLPWNFIQEVPVENAIIYGVNGHVINATGIFMKDTHHIKDVAIVNVAWEHAPGGAGSSFGEGTCQDLDHLLMWHTTANGAASIEYTKLGYVPAIPGQARPMKNCSFIGTHWWGINLNGWAVSSGIDELAWDYTNVTANWGGRLDPGTNCTVSPDGPMLDSELHPQPGSPLLNRIPYLVVPVDAGGNIRTVPTSVGAYE